MTTHDPLLIYFIAIAAIFALVVARRRMQQLKRIDPTWDAERIKKWNRTDKKVCIYCETTGTKNRVKGDPCCMGCEAELFP